MLEPLNPALNAAVLAIVAKLLPEGFDVANDAPATYEALRAHVADTGRICVWSGASDQTIFGDPAVNYAFRAWHDWVHWRYSLPFTAEGERRVSMIQCRQLRAMRPLSGRDLCYWVHAEVVGQLEYKARWGSFPEDQRAFCLAYLGHRVRALGCKF